MKKSVFVTGATNGTGYAIAERFAREGYDVFIGSRELEKSSEAAKSISEKYGVFAKGYEYQTVTLDEAQVKSIFIDIDLEADLTDAEICGIENYSVEQIAHRTYIVEY